MNLTSVGIKLTTLSGSKTDNVQSKTDTPIGIVLLHYCTGEQIPGPNIFAKRELLY